MIRFNNQAPIEPIKSVDFWGCDHGYKWLCSPKGAGFLYARPAVQPLIEPLVVGWGWGEKRTMTFGSDYLDYLQWLGTNDLSAYLAVPAAIAFQDDHNWPAVRDCCHQLLQHGLADMEALTGLAGVYPTPEAYRQMAIARLPAGLDPLQLHTELYNQYRVEIPCYVWEGQNFIRLSVQGYNDEQDIDRLVAALRSLLS